MMNSISCANSFRRNASVKCDKARIRRYTRLSNGTVNKQIGNGEAYLPGLSCAGDYIQRRVPERA
jgi:hypothetical protein